MVAVAVSSRGILQRLQVYRLIRKVILSLVKGIVDIMIIWQVTSVLQPFTNVAFLFWSGFYSARCFGVVEPPSFEFDVGGLVSFRCCRIVYCVTQCRILRQRVSHLLPFLFNKC
jgi:hypothetical protein